MLDAAQSYPNGNPEPLFFDEALFRSLVEYCLEGVILMSPDWQVKYLNPAYTRIFGYTLATLPNGNTFSIVHPDDQAILQERTAQMLTGTRTGTPAEFRAFHQDGSLRYIEGWGKVLPSGEIAAFLHDITLRKMSEMALRESEERFRAMFELSSDSIVFYDENFQLKYANAAYRRLMNYHGDENPPPPTGYPILHPDDIPATQSAMTQFMSSYEMQTVPCRVYDAEDKLHYLEGYIRRLPNGEIVAANRDVTEQYTVQEALRKSEEKFRTLIETSAAGIATYTQDGSMTYISPSFSELFGYTADELPNLKALDFVHPDYITKGAEILSQLFSGQIKQAAMQYPFKHKNGMYRYVDGYARLLPDGDVVAYVADITEQVEAQAALAESEARYRILNTELEHRIQQRTAELEATVREQRRLAAIIEATTDYVGIADLAGWSQYINQNGRKMVGKTEEDFLQPWNMVGCHPEREHPKLFEVVAQAAQGQSASVETILLHKSGREIPVSMVSVPLKNAQGEVEALAAIMRDITDQKRASAELQRARDIAENALADQRRLIQIIETTSDLVAMISQTGMGIYLNPAGRDLLGIGKDEDITAQNMMVHYPPEVIQEIMQVHVPYAIANGGVWKGENALINRAGDLIPISQAGLIIFDEHGEIEYLATIARDISDRKRFEQELHQAKNAAESASRAKSTFLANMSHEIRTPMNAIIGMTSLLLDTPLQAKQRDFVETIRTSGDSLLTIINDILDFSKIEAEKLELVYRPFNLRECIEAALDLLAPIAAEKHIDLAYVIDEHVPAAIVGDVTRLRQVLVNLLSNAVKFTAHGEVVVTVSAITGKKKRHELHFSVRDTGIGVSADKMDRLFKAFSQVDASMTREFGGTGLGLAISKRLSEMMGGSIWAESEGIPGRGTTFHFTILAEESKETVKTFLQVKQPRLTKKSMLIVDDNATNRRILSLQAQTWGMVAHAAALPSEALALLQSIQFDVAILDMHMPEMDGCELAQAIRKLPQGRDLPLFMLSSAVKNGNCDDFIAVLAKPIKPSELYNNLLGLFASNTNQPIVEIPPQLDDMVLADRLPLHILLAEDVLVNQKFAVHALDRMGYRVDVVANGQEVLDAVQRQKYDVILMDVQMPVMDGLEATRQIRGYDIPQPQIIAMTANAMQGDREICLEAGMDDYISKPVYLQELRAALERVGTRLKRFTTTEHISVLSPPIVAPVHFEEESMLDPDIIEIFLEEMPQTIAELRAAAVSNDAKGMAAAVHKIKGSASYIGAVNTQKIAAEIERLARAGDISGATAFLPDLDAELQGVMASLQRILGQS